MGTPVTATIAQGNLQTRLKEARSRTDEIFRIVRPEAICDRPIVERHRLIFYLGHLEAFDWNLLSQRALGLRSFHPAFDRLFAFGIDPVGGGLPADQPQDWPARAEIEAYNRRTRDTLDAEIGRSLESSSSDHPQLKVMLEAAIEHRLMHAETLAYLLHQLPVGKKFPGPVAAASSESRGKFRMIEIPAGRATLGRHAESGGFGWDNEFNVLEANVPEFAIDGYNVTNGDFLRFVEAGGYGERNLWSAADWAWKEAAGVHHPVLWKREGNLWLYRAMFAEIRLPLDWPVYASHAEATAYANWLGRRLPTEEEFHRAAYGTPKGGELSFPWGEEQPAEAHGNFDFRAWDPSPVGSHPAGASAFGVQDLLGNGWEWTRSVFGPLPGFAPFTFYPGYSADFFDGKHYVLKGGSPRTAGCMLRRSFRNWFQGHYPYVYAAFRCVQD